MTVVTCLVLSCILHAIQGMDLFHGGLEVNNKDTSAVDVVVQLPDIPKPPVDANFSEVNDVNIFPVNITVQAFACTSDNCTFINMQKDIMVPDVLNINLENPQPPPGIPQIKS